MNRIQCLTEQSRAEQLNRTNFLGSINGFGAGYAGAVFDSEYLSPTLTTMQGGGREPHILQVEKLGNVYGEQFTGGNYGGNVWNDNGLAPTLKSSGSASQEFCVDVKKVNYTTFPQTVRVRKYEIDKMALCDLLRKSKSEKKLNNKQISKELNVPKTMVEHWFRRDDGFAIPEDAIWFQLKELLGITTSKYDDAIMTFEERDGVFEKAERVYFQDGIAPTILTESCNEKILEVTKMENINTLGGLTENSNQRNVVYGADGISPTLQQAMGSGGCQVPLVADVIIGSLQDHAAIKKDGICTSLTSAMGSGGGQIPMVTEQQIVAMRGRNPENPANRDKGINLEQTLEPNKNGTSNTITSVEKDNLVLETTDVSALRMVRTDEGKALRKAYESGEIHHGFNEYREAEPREDELSNTVSTVTKDNIVLEEKKVVGIDEQNMAVRTNTFGTLTTDGNSPKHNNRVGEMAKIKIRQATKGGFVDCEIPGVADLNYVSSQTRRGRVVEGGQVTPTICAENPPSLIELGDPDFYNFLYEIDGEIYLIRIRKLIPRECLRLMDVDEDVIDRMEMVESNTNLYKAAGNSIVVNCLVAIFGQMFEGKENVYKNAANTN